MKRGSIEKRIDNLGRLVIPSHFRKALSIKKGDVVEINRFGNYIILNKENPAPGVLVDNNNIIYKELEKTLNLLRDEDLLLMLDMASRLAYD